MKLRVLLGGVFILTALVQSPDARQGPGRMGGPPPGRERPILAQFDQDKNNRLNATERKAAREFLATQPATGPGRGGRGGMAAGPVEPGVRLTPKDVKAYGSEPLYDMATLRTLFLQFESDDWEAELAAFNNTDVDVPATLVVDGKTYNEVGVHFRGASSFFTVPAGRKRSLNLAMDFAQGSQRLGGYSTINLLNSHTDPTFLRTVLYLEAARAYVPAPKANYLRVVINGESWGVYVSPQQFNREFINEWFKTTDGSRWKVPGSPGGRAGMEYLGEDVAPYKNLFEIKSKDNPKSWADLIRLTRILNETPPADLARALAPILDVDATLKFLALEVALVNQDGYWVRASDYSLYQDVKGRFHVFPHDANETFLAGRGGGPRGGPPPPGGQAGPPRAGGPGGGVELDPLVGLNDTTKPLRSKLLAVPELRDQYLRHVRDIAEKWLDWNKIGPLVTRYQGLIAADVKADTRKLDSYEAFEAGVATLRDFVERRRAFLLSYKPKTN